MAWIGQGHLSVAEVAALLGVDPRTVRSDIRSGRLPAKRVGRRGVYRIDPVDLDTAICAAAVDRPERTEATASQIGASASPSRARLATTGAV